MQTSHTFRITTTISHKFPLNGHTENPTKRYSIHNGKKIIYIMAKTFLNTVPRVVHDCSVETSGWNRRIVASFRVFFAL